MELGTLPIDAVGVTMPGDPISEYCEPIEANELSKFGCNDGCAMVGETAALKLCCAFNWLRAA